MSKYLYFGFILFLVAMAAALPKDYNRLKRSPDPHHHHHIEKVIVNVEHDHGVHPPYHVVDYHYVPIVKTHYYTVPRLYHFISGYGVGYGYGENNHDHYQSPSSSGSAIAHSESWSISDGKNSGGAIAKASAEARSHSK